MTEQEGNSVRVQNNSPRNIWVLIKENTRQLTDSETKVVGETEFEQYYEYVVEGNIKSPIPIEMGGRNERKFKERLKTYWESSAKESYVWSGFVEPGQVELQPGKSNVWARQSPEGIYYISIRSNGTMIVDAMSRRDNLITIDENGYINDEPAAPIAIANKQAVHLHWSKKLDYCVGDPKTGSGRNWDAGTFGKVACQPPDVPLDVVETVDLLQRAKVHVKPAIDLDLQAVPTLFWQPVALDDIGPLIRMVDGHRIAHRLQPLRDKRRESRLAARALQIAQHEIGATFSGIGRRGAAHRPHRMPVHVPDAADVTLRLGECRLERDMVRPPAAIEPAAYLLERQLPFIDRGIIVHAPEDQSRALFRLARRRKRLGPHCLEHLLVDVIGRPVRVDIGAREMRCDGGYAVACCVLDQNIDELILIFPQ